jgi:sorting nexin-25
VPHSPDTRHHSRPSVGEAHPQQFIRLTPRDDERTFERFIRSIRLCSNLSDARRLRNEITAQLKRDAKSEGIEGYAVYLRRLETGKRLIEQKVAHLSAGPGGGRRGSLAEGAMIRSQSEVALKNPTSRLESATLEEVMQDSAGLSYFMVRGTPLPVTDRVLNAVGIHGPQEASGTGAVLAGSQRTA